jgi:hypothetical protein
MRNSGSTSGSSADADGRLVGCEGAAAAEPAGGEGVGGAAGPAGGEGAAAEVAGAAGPAGSEGAVAEVAGSVSGVMRFRQASGERQA